MARKTASQIRLQAWRMVSELAGERMRVGDPAGSAELEDLAVAILRIPLSTTDDIDGATS